MGNCQAVDTASLVIQHPNGKLERLYSPLTANHVMKTNPGHYVALLISSTTLCSSKDDDNNNNNNPVRLTRIKLLKPADTLVLGQVYRLISAQEVMKGLLAKKQAKMKKNLSESSALKPHHQMMKEKPSLEMDKAEQENKSERHGSRTTTTTSSNATANKSRTWQPSLQSISEATS